MKYALLSDIHGNLPALEAVLEDLDRRPDVDAIYHLGDLVGYGPWPNEVVARLRARAIAGVAGNYDSTSGTNFKNCGLRYDDPRRDEQAEKSYAWTQTHLSYATKHYLGTLPFRMDLRLLGGHLTGGPALILVHAAPTRNTVEWTEDRPDSFCLDAAREAGMSPGDAIAFGHTHRPWYREAGGMHFLNVGSVGLPRDGNWQTGYALLESGGESPHVTFVRLDYDLERAVRGIEGHGLPLSLAEDLRTGGAAPPDATERTQRSEENRRSGRAEVYTPPAARLD